MPRDGVPVPGVGSGHVPRPAAEWLNRVEPVGVFSHTSRVLTTVAAGFGTGVLVAAEVGPIWLLCARTALRGSFASAVAVGGGAAVVDTLYACLGVAGAAPLLRIGALRAVLGVAGAVVLVLLGARSLRSAWRVRMGGEADSEVDGPLRALCTSLAATASNPVTILSWAAVFSAASTARVASGGVEVTVFLAAIGLGSLSWFIVLAGAMSLLRRRIGPRLLRTADALAGAGLVGFGAAMGWRTAHDAR